MLQPSRRDLLQQQFKQTQIKQERKMLDVTLTFTALFSVLFLLVGGIIGWLYWLNPSKMNLIMNNFSNDVLENIYKLVTLIS